MNSNGNLGHVKMKEVFSTPKQQNPFVGRHWGRYRYEQLVKLEALLVPEERKLMAWMAANVFTGSGEIVDAGAFLGGSAACFAHGLKKNEGVIRKDGRIHSYDLFRKANWLRSPVEAWDAKNLGQSTLDVFHDQLGESDYMVSLYPGDITNRNWSAGNIEFLMLDCSKTEALNDHCLRMFFQWLIPGKSFLIHQDYAIHSGLYWLHSTMYLLRDYFEHVATVQYGGTAVFRNVKQITPEVIESVIKSQNENLSSIEERAIEHARLIGDKKIMDAIAISFKSAPK